MKSKKFYSCTCYGHGLMIEKDEDNLFWITKVCLGSKGERLPFLLRLKYAWQYLFYNPSTSLDEVVLDRETTFELANDLLSLSIEYGKVK